MEHSKFLPTNQPSRPSIVSESHLLHTDYAAKRARLLLSSYLRDDSADADSFSMQLIKILAGYRREIIDYVTSPDTGLQRRLKFRPSLAEVVEACDEHARHLDLVRAPRPKLLSQPFPRPRSSGPTFTDLVEKHGRPIGFFERG